MPTHFRDLLLAAAAGGRPLVGGHRGARSLAPENTLPAASQAHAASADFWELDVALTLDGQIIVIHDDTLRRTSNASLIFPERAPWAVHEFILSDIRRLDFGTWFLEQDPYGQIAAGALTAAELQSYAGTKAPTLQEALALTARLGWYVNVEIKDLAGKPGESRIVRETINLIVQMDLTAQVLISSFRHDYLRQARDLNREIAIAALVDEDHISSDPAGYLKSLKAQAWHPPARANLRDLVPAVRRAGLAVNVWAYKEPDETPGLLNAEASGIITSFPQQVVGTIRPVAERDAS